MGKAISLARLGVVRRAGWNVVDQALSALTNVVLTFVVARSVDAHDFGAFSVAFLVFSLVIGAERALIGEPLAIRHSHEPVDQQHRTVGGAFGTALAMSLLVSAVSAVAGFALQGTLGRTLVALAVVLPFLILQDTARMAFFAWARPRDATLNDALWAVVQFALIGAVVATGHATPANLVLCWGAGAVAAVVVAVVQLRAWHLGGVNRWVGQHRDLAGYLIVEYLVGVGAFQGGLLLVGASLGVGDIGSLRAAQVLLGPIGIVATASITFGVPEVARRRTLPARTEGVAAIASGALVAVTGVYILVLLLIPDDLGTALLGDTWTGASSVLLPVALGSLASSGKLGPVVFIYGLGLARRSVWLVTLLGILAFGFMIAGAWWDDARGLAWGLFLAQAIVMPCWFILLRVVVRQGFVPAGATATGGAEHAEPGRPVE